MEKETQRLENENRLCIHSLLGVIPRLIFASTLRKTFFFLCSPSGSQNAYERADIATRSGLAQDRIGLPHCYSNVQ